jgi:uncharacterized protein (DUF1330 family)
MSALYIVFVDKPSDPGEIAEYRRLALPTLKGRAVKFHARPGCELHTVEGDEVDVAVVLEFDSIREAKDWYHSPEYQNAVKHRLGTARSRAVIVETLRNS